MQRLSLPPVGALTDVSQLKPGDRLYIVSPAVRDQSMLWAQVSKEGVEVSRDDPARLRGLRVWNRNAWDDLRVYMVTLNLRAEGNAEINDYNDIYVFRNFELATKYEDFCISSPDREHWHDYGNDHKRSKALGSSLPKRDGERARIQYE